MKFKQFLKESASYYKSMADVMSLSRIPITTKIAKSLGYGGTTKKVYHVSTTNFIKNMVNIQKTKKHISTFTHGLQHITNAISVKPDLMFELEGTAVMDFKHDIFSHPDKRGRRWISTRGHPKSQFLQEGINLKIIKLMFELSGTSGDAYAYIDDDYKYTSLFESLEPNDQEKVVTAYIKKVQDMMEKPMYNKIVTEILAVNKINSSYDEIILNNFKIKGVYSLENGKYQFNHDDAEKFIKSHKIKYLGHLSLSDFSKY